MLRLRRFFIRRSRLFAPHLLRQSLLLLALLLLWDGIAAFYGAQIQTALSLNTAASQPVASVSTPTIVPLTTGPTAGVLASDTFLRPNRLYWGTSSDGHNWQADAGHTRYFSIFEHMGVVNTPPQAIACDGILGPTVLNAEITFSAALSHYGPATLGAVLRWSDPGDFYTAYLDGRELVVARVMAGMVTPLQSMPFQAQNGILYTFRFRATAAQLFVMVWPTAQPAPDGWQIQVEDSALPAGHAGIRVFSQSSVQAKFTTLREDAL